LQILDPYIAVSEKSSDSCVVVVVVVHISSIIFSLENCVRQRTVTHFQTWIKMRVYARVVKLRESRFIMRGFLVDSGAGGHD
jgi:hypothetical protein